MVETIYTSGYVWARFQVPTPLESLYDSSGGSERLRTYCTMMDGTDEQNVQGGSEDGDSCHADDRMSVIRKRSQPVEVLRRQPRLYPRHFIPRNPQQL